MRRLKIHRAALSLPQWAIACILLNVLAVLLYLIERRRIWKKLLDAAWQFVGDDAYSPDARRARLDALRDCGVIGEPVYWTATIILAGVAATVMAGGEA